MFSIGLLVGIFVGFGVIGLCVAGSRNDLERRGDGPTNGVIEPSPVLAHKGGVKRYN
jgi:hypothetical protein